MMQNHLEISSKSEFWTRDAPNWSKCLYGKLTEIWRNLPRPPRPVQEGPYGPIRAHKGPHGPIYGPIRAHMGPNPDGAPMGRPPKAAAPLFLGPSPGWGPVRVGAHMDPYGPLWAHMGPYGSSWTGLGKSVNFPSTFRRDFRTNFARFGSKTKILIRFLNDYASFLLLPEKLKNHFMFTKNPNTWPIIFKILQKF